jgi:L-threonylcarbamoyladenylate synthase
VTRTRYVKVDPRDPDVRVLADAAAAIVRGGLVAFPTETVYGLGAHALDPSAVDAIFRAKGRPSTDPVIVHLADADQLREVADLVPAAGWELARRFWPGPLTLIVRKQPIIPDAVTAGLPTVGVRVPAHPVARMLLSAAGVPVAAPSANRFSHPSPTSAEHVLADLDGRIDLVIDAGPTPIGVESTILDLTVSPPLVRRPGGVTLADIRAVVGDAESITATYGHGVAQPAPGQLLRHYAPRAPLTLYLGEVAAVTGRMAEDARTATAAGSRVGILSLEEDLRALAPRIAALTATGRLVTMRYGSRADAAAAAHDLFRALRAIDAQGVDIILASAPTTQDLGAAIVDRLSRAAAGRVVRLDD